mgnify:FL=1
MKIAHMADIHIKNYQDYERYKDAFGDLSDSLMLNNVDVVVVAGDIGHTKNNISPEFVYLVQDFFRNISGFGTRKVFYSLGNHDLNLRNKDRLDAISPIVNALKYDCVTFMDKSGAYPIDDNVVLWNYSIKDATVPSFVRSEALEGKMAIGVYHGVVNGSKTDLGWSVSDHAVDVSVFKGLDLVFLGDIHKRQSIGHAHYPGSLIQQNFGEDKEKGFLLWDIDGPKVTKKFIPVIVDCGYHVFNHENIQDLNNVQNGYRAKFKIVADENLPLSSARLLAEYAKRTYQASLVVIQDNTKKILSENIKDMKERGIKNDHLTAFLEEMNLGPETIKSVHELDKKVSSEIKLDNPTGNWKIHKMSWDNTYRYGENNSINFDNLSGLIGIFGGNYTGKSSCLDTIMYSMFNTSFRGIRKNFDIVNKNKDYCSSEVDFAVNGERFRLNRKTTKKKTDAKTDMNILKLDGDKYINVDGLDRKDGDKLIKSLIGTPEDFMLTSFATQKNANSFVNEGNTERRKILYRFLGLEQYEKKHLIAKDMASELKAKIKQKPSSIVNIEESRKRVEELNDIVFQNAELIKRYSSEVNTLVEELKEHLSATEKHSKNQSMKKMAEAYVANIDKIKSDIQAKTFLLHSAKEKEELLSTTIHSLREKQQQSIDLVSRVDKLRLETGALKKQIKGIEEEAKILQEVPCGNLYQSCKFLAKANQANNLLPELIDSFNTKVTEGKSLKELIESIDNDDVTNAINSYQQAAKEHNQLKIELSLLKERLSTQELNLNKANKDITEMTERENELLLCDFETKKAQMNEMKVESKRLVEETDRSRIEMAKLIGILEQYDLSLSEYETNVKEYEVYELYMKAMHVSGVPSLILKDMIPSINESINSIMDNVCDFTVELMDRDGKLDIMIKRGESLTPIESCSGAEETLSSMAIRVAMCEHSQMVKPDFFILDEPATSLDSSNLANFIKMLEMIKSRFRIVFLVTHIELLKDHVDQLIEIDSDGEYSQVIH